MILCHIVICCVLVQVPLQRSLVSLERDESVAQPGTGVEWAVWILNKCNLSVFIMAAGEASLAEEGVNRYIHMD